MASTVFPASGIGYALEAEPGAGAAGAGADVFSKFIDAGLKVPLAYGAICLNAKTTPFVILSSPVGSPLPPRDALTGTLALLWQFKGTF